MSPCGTVAYDARRKPYDNAGPHMSNANRLAVPTCSGGLGLPRVRIRRHGGFRPNPRSDPVEGGSANDYDYANGDPVNGLDLNGLHACAAGLRHRTYFFGTAHGCSRPNGNVGPNKTNAVAKRLIPFTGGSSRPCATSGGGAQVYCVENVNRLPAADPGAGAVTYGHYIFCTTSCDRLLTHELVHVGQFEQYGDRFAGLYLAEAARNGTGCGNKYEFEAYTAPGGGGCP